MIIVAGRISTAAGRRDAFVTTSIEAVAAARGAPGGLDVVVAADPIDPDRVNVYEWWTSVAALEDFRGEGEGEGPGPELAADIVTAAVAQYEVRQPAS
ncbi:MAG: putative quinol monooxygenase [Acidimicrobiia bacterium]